jgi:Arc/MetJ-type ribon-helix-helix transcriptional regulator
LRNKGERITIRLPEKDLRFIDSFIEKEEEFGSRSELLRVAAKDLIDKKIALSKGESDETYVALSDDQVYAIDYLIKNGRFKSRSAALFEILRNYLDSVEWEKLEEGQKKLQNIKYDVESARMMDKKIEKDYLKH